MGKSGSPAVRGTKAAVGSQSPSLYERIGGEKMERLVAAFYARVDSDPVIRPLYGKTLTCAIHALTDFLTTWSGGPPVYDVRGARLRRRHVPFAIDARAREAWLANMKSAVREVGIPATEARLLWHTSSLVPGRSSTPARRRSGCRARSEATGSTPGWQSSGTGWRRPRIFLTPYRTATSPSCGPCFPCVWCPGRYS